METAIVWAKMALLRAGCFLSLKLEVRGMSSAFRIQANFLSILLDMDAIEPRGSRYQIIKDLGPNSHYNHGL